MAVIVLIGTMLALSALGLPLVFGLLAASVATFVLFRPGIPLEVIAQSFTAGLEHSALFAVGFFFLVGELMNAGGITRRIVDFANALVGFIRGGLAHVTIVSSMLFAGISGSAVADSAAVGSVLIPSMKKNGYSAGFAAAVTETASVIGPIIPPSIPMIVFAVLAEVSIGKLFLAGVVPGFLVGGGLMAVAFVISRRRAYPKDSAISLKRIVVSGKSALVALFAPVIILGGVLGGVFTATESGAIGAFYCFIVGRFVLRELSWADCWQAVVRSAVGTATVMVILGAAMVFAWLAAEMEVTTRIGKFMFSISQERWAFLLMINIVLLIIGLFLDPLPALIIAVPIFLPIATQIGIDPIHFGVITVMNLLIGLCTPPVGFLIYMTATMAKAPVDVVIRESVPFMAVLVGVLFLVTYVPVLPLALANYVFP